MVWQGDFSTSWGCEPPCEWHPCASGTWGQLTVYVILVWLPWFNNVQDLALAFKVIISAILCSGSKSLVDMWGRPFTGYPGWLWDCRTWAFYNSLMRNSFSCLVAAGDRAPWRLLLTTSKHHRDPALLGKTKLWSLRTVSLNSPELSPMLRRLPVQVLRFGDILWHRFT